MDQAQQPLLSALKQSAQQPHCSFYAPGHKQGVGAVSSLRELLGSQVFTADLPELPELDTCFLLSPIAMGLNDWLPTYGGRTQLVFGQRLNGGNCGRYCANCGEGDKVILPRNSHQAAIAGIIQAGAIPIFVNPVVNGDWDLAWSITPAQLARTLSAHPDAKAVLLLHPTYHGVVGELEALINRCHEVDLPVIVDEAHAAHFPFHPQLPPSALASGADITVQSTHKLLGALTQASMLHCRGERVSPQRLSQMLQLLQTSSPSYLLLASLDATRYQMAHEGQSWLNPIVAASYRCREQLATIPGLSLLSQPNPLPGFAALDPTRITVDATAWGLSGFDLDDLLRERFSITAELPTLRQLSFIVSIGNTESDLTRLVWALQTLAQENATHSPLTLTLPPLPPALLAAIAPRQAAFAPQKMRPVAQAVDCISAQLLCPYPPGIPVLIPGEIISPLGDRLFGCGTGCRWIGEWFTAHPG